MTRQSTQARVSASSSWGILALIAEFENDIRRERQMDGIKKARECGTRFGRKPLLVSETIQQVRKLRKGGKTVPEIMRQNGPQQGKHVSGTWSGHSLSGELGLVIINAYLNSSASHVRFEGYCGRVS